MDYYYVSNNGASPIYHWAKQSLQSSQPIQPSPSTQVVNLHSRPNLKRLPEHLIQGKELYFHYFI